MDMNVDTRVLESLRLYLRDCSNSLDGACNDLESFVIRANQTLEGQQYSISVDETKMSCKIINSSINNLSSLMNYLERLENDVNDYLSCKYRG